MIVYKIKINSGKELKHKPPFWMPSQARNVNNWVLTLTNQENRLVDNPAEQWKVLAKQGAKGSRNLNSIAC